ncbi:DUF1549 domain-containing protein [Planctomycetaceae bacterium SH139]
MPKPSMSSSLTPLSPHAAFVKLVLIAAMFSALPADRQLEWGAGLASAGESGQVEVTFKRDVMAVLSKAGCNAGTCHGNVNGKGGFFLSLRGQDPSYDYRQLVRSAAGRRVDPMVPAQSLALLKATAEVAHQGGKRFSRDSPEYEILFSWIEQGLAAPESQAPVVTRLEVTPADQVLWAPQREVQLTTIAHFSDGSARDVTRLAVYESSDPLVEITPTGIVQFDQPTLVTLLVRYLDGQFPVRLAYRPVPQQFTWQTPAVNNFIDELVFARLQQLQINPAPLATDQVFLRRIYLDLLGVLPTAEEAHSFVLDQAFDKREKLVESLLSRPEFATMWALKWSDIIRNEEKTLDALGVEKLHAWIRDSIAADRPLNQFARELIASRGSTYDNPPANYWRAHRDPFTRSETTAQVFLGVRLQCAKCHNHPFDHWSQDEYYQWASLFNGIEYEIVDNKRRDNLDKHEFVGEQMVQVKSAEPVNNVRTGQPANAKLLGSDEAIGDDQLQHLADWLASPENRMFATAQTNRIWYHLMGAGLVEPVDDLRLTNPASHPELLRRLTDELIEHDFSLKHLVRLIVNSRTYQLGSELDPAEVAPHQYHERLFARAVVRRLTAEQILDIQSQVLGLPASFEGYDPGTRAGQIAGVERVRRKLADGDVFLRQFGKPERLLACECERSNEATLGQALSLIGGESLHRRLIQTDNRLGELLAASDDIPEIIETLFWTALTRAPTEQELTSTLSLIEQHGDPRAVLEDLVWALLNAKELIFRN